jgi:hypothetical protein
MNGVDGKSVSSFLCKAHSTIPQGVVALRRKKIVDTLLTFQCLVYISIEKLRDQCDDESSRKVTKI